MTDCKVLTVEVKQEVKDTRTMKRSWNNHNFIGHRDTHAAAVHITEYINTR